MNNGVLILECLSKSDPGSEGRFLSHMFDLMQVKSQYVEVRTHEQLFAMIQSCPFEYIHITTHGSVSEEEKFRGWWTPNGTAKKSRISALEGKVSCKAIISTACLSGTKGFGEYVVNKLGSKYYVGPNGSPKFHNSVFFAHIFYHKIFILGSGVKKAVASYRTSYKNPHKFTVYVRRNSNNSLQGRRP